MKKQRDIGAVPLREKLPDVPITIVRVADSIPRDERSFKKTWFTVFQVGMYKLLPPIQHGLPSIDADPHRALDYAYTARHRKYFPPPVLPKEYEGSLDLGSLAVRGPYACYTEKIAEGEYQWDFRMLGGYGVQSDLHKLGARVLFRLQAPTRSLQASQIETVLDSSHPGDATWPLATKLVLCAATTHMSLVRHFNWVHLASASHLAIATRNCLPPDHPLCRLLWPYMYGTQQSNEIVTKAQMVPLGDFETIFSFTHMEMCRLFAETYAAFPFIVNDPEQDARRRGLKDGALATPTQDNLEALFNVMHDHARDYLPIYYPDSPPGSSDAAIRNNEPILQWLDALNALIPNGVGVTRASVTFDDLARLVARFIYLVTVQHELVGTFLWNYQMWTHRQPARVYKDGRREPLDVYQRLVNANYNLNVNRARLLADYSELALDPAGKEVFTTFQKQLKELQRNMDEEPWAYWKIYPKMLEVNINA